jgi:uncharacterized protein (DUF58 family)
MPLPSSILKGLTALWLTLAIASSLLASWRQAWEVGGALLAAVLLADLMLALQRGCPIEVERDCAKSWPVGVAQEIVLRLSRTSRAGRLRGALFDHVPAGVWYENLPGRFELGASEERVSYKAVATTRGELYFGDIELRLESPLRLWNWAHLLADDRDKRQSVRVYPDFARIARYALLATDHRLSQIGLLLRRRRGEGLEFHQLREYRQGDALRQIDWKATSRHRKLISREYEDERNQQIVFLLDCGQRMATRERGGEPSPAADALRAAPELSHFDHALNAMLLLSYVALRQGDGVGFETIAHPRPRHVAVRRSLGAMNHLMESVYDLEPSALIPDFQEIGSEVARRVRKRSLIVILSNLRDEDDETLEPALARMARQHVVLLASLREPGLTRALEQPVRKFDDALLYAAASEYNYARQRTSLRLRARGVDCIEVAPAGLPMLLVNRYWQVKRSGVL